MLEDVKHFRGAVHGMRTGREDVGFAVLHGLKHPSHVMIEPFGQSCRISIREQSCEIRWLRRVASKELDLLLVLEHSRNLVACEQHRDLAGSRGEPFHQLPLGMRVRPIYFIQYQTHRHLVSSKEGRNTACILARLCQGLYIRKATKRSGCVQLQGLEPT